MSSKSCIRFSRKAIRKRETIPDLAYLDWVQFCLETGGGNKWPPESLTTWGAGYLWFSHPLGRRCSLSSITQCICLLCCCLKSEAFTNWKLKDPSFSLTVSMKSLSHARSGWKRQFRGNMSLGWSIPMEVTWLLPPDQAKLTSPFWSSQGLL
jgi:hypothetical protein